MTTIEQELGQAIEDETGRIQEAGPDFFAAVDARIRHRRRQRRATTAALAVGLAAAVGAGVIAAPGWRTSTVEMPPTTQLAPVFGPDRLPNFDRLSDVAKVWPNAVRTLPRRLPNGADYVVRAVLPEGRYLILEWRPYSAGFTLEHPTVFEPATGALRRLADPSAMVGFTLAGVSGANAVWVTSDPETFADEIWTAPLAGGPARKLIRLPNVTPDKVFVDGFTIAGDYVMWHAEREVVREGTKVGEKLGIFRIPIAGGSVTPVPDTVGFQFTRDYSGFGGVAAIAERPTATGGDLLDLATGRRTTWTRAAGTNNWPLTSCGLVGCIGAANTGGTGPIVWQPDGSGLLKLEKGQLSPTGDGRFLSYRYYAQTGTREPSLIVWDRATGRAAVCYRKPATDARPQPGDDYHLGRSFLTWEADDGLHVLDLTKIG
jgi:hypothetical protein